MTTSKERPSYTSPATSSATRASGLILCLAVVSIHVIDQGGLPGDKSPAYIAAAYYLLEVAGLVAVVLLLRRPYRAGWLLAAGVALGPIVGYILSRGPGLPDYSDDRGNWGEPLGVVSLVVEGALLVLSISCLVAGSRRSTQGRRVEPEAVGSGAASARRSGSPVH